MSDGRPIYFISHVWGRPFVETVEMVKLHFSPERQRGWKGDKRELEWSEVSVETETGREQTAHNCLRSAMEEVQMPFVPPFISRVG